MIRGGIRNRFGMRETLRHKSDFVYGGVCLCNILFRIHLKCEETDLFLIGVLMELLSMLNLTSPLSVRLMGKGIRCMEHVMSVYAGLLVFTPAFE